MTVTFRPFWCVTRSAAATEVSSSHVTMIYETISSTSPDKPYPLTTYKANPSSTRAAAYQRGDIRHRRNIPETRGDVLIRRLWEIQTDAIIDIRFGDAGAETYVKERMDTTVPRWDQMKNENHERHFHKAMEKISPFSLSVDVVLGK